MRQIRAARRGRAGPGTLLHSRNPRASIALTLRPESRCRVRNARRFAASICLHWQIGLHDGPEPRGSALLRDERSGLPGGGGSKHNSNICSDSEARIWRPTLDGLAPAGLLLVVAANSPMWGRLSRTHDIRIRADRREFHTPPIACPRTRMCWASPSLAHSSSESYGGGGTCLSLEDLRLRAPACHSYVALSGCGCSGYTYATESSRRPHISALLFKLSACRFRVTSSWQCQSQLLDHLILLCFDHPGLSMLANKITPHPRIGFLNLNPEPPSPESFLFNNLFGD